MIHVNSQYDHYGDVKDKFSKKLEPLFLTNNQTQIQTKTKSDTTYTIKVLKHTDPIHT
jgi:hypothetical protein